MWDAIVIGSSVGGAELELEPHAATRRSRTLRSTPTARRVPRSPDPAPQPSTTRRFPHALELSQRLLRSRTTAVVKAPTRRPSHCGIGGRPADWGSSPRVGKAKRALLAAALHVTGIRGRVRMMGRTARSRRARRRTRDNESSRPQAAGRSPVSRCGPAWKAQRRRRELECRSARRAPVW